MASTISLSLSFSPSLSLVHHRRISRESLFKLQSLFWGRSKFNIADSIIHPQSRGSSRNRQPELGRQLEQLENQPERLGRQPELPWSTEDHAVVLATIAVLIAIAGVKIQNASDNPFHSRPATMSIIFTALSIYGFAAAQTRPIILDGKQQQILMWRIIYYFYQLLNSLVLISKVVCQACIVSLFIPYGLGWNVYVACASTSCFGVAVWAILRNFAPSCVVRLVPCMGPTGSSGGRENNDGDSDSGNDGRNQIEESNASPVCGSSVVSENQSSSQQGGTSSSVPSHQTDHSTQAKRGLFLQPELGRQLEQLENQPERLGRQPELPWSTEDPAVVLATIAALIAIAGVKFQNASDNPFHSRPATMTSIFIALLIYGFAAAQTRPIILDGKQQKILMWRIIYYFYRLLNSLILISKVVCQACIVSLFIPYGLRWNVYVACASTSCFGVAVLAILRNFAPSCVVRLVPCMGPIGSSGGSENNDGDSDSGNDGRNRIEESNASPVCGSSVVSENQSSSQQGGTSSSVPSHQTDHSTQADGKTANTGNAVLLHIIQSSPHKGTESEAHPNPDEKPIQSPKPLEVASQRSQAGPV